MLYRPRRRWPNIEPTIGQSLVFAAILWHIIAIDVFCGVRIQPVVSGHNRTCVMLHNSDQAVTLQAFKDLKASQQKLLLANVRDIKPTLVQRTVRNVTQHITPRSRATLYRLDARPKYPKQCATVKYSCHYGSSPVMGCHIGRIYSVPTSVLTQHPVKIRLIKPFPAKLFYLNCYPLEMLYFATATHTSKLVKSTHAYLSNLSPNICKSRLLNSQVIPK